MYTLDNIKSLQSSIAAQKHVAEFAPIIIMASRSWRPQCNRSNLKRQDHKGEAFVYSYKAMFIASMSPNTFSSSCLLPIACKPTGAPSNKSFWSIDVIFQLDPPKGETSFYSQVRQFPRSAAFMGAYSGVSRSKDRSAKVMGKLPLV